MGRKRFIDLSISIEAGLPSDPPMMIPKIDYVTHEMGAEQMKIRQLVIEGIRVELHHLGVPAFVFCMAAGAALLANGGIQTMETGASFKICRHVFVTVQAQNPLAVAGKGQVALITIGFEIRVAANDRPGHNQAFKVHGPCRNTCTANCQSHHKSHIPPHCCRLPA